MKRNLKILGICTIIYGMVNLLICLFVLCSSVLMSNQAFSIKEKTNNFVVKDYKTNSNLGYKSESKVNDEFVKEINHRIIYFFKAIIIFTIIISLLTILSGISIIRHKGRVFSLIMAGNNIISLPFGLVLGLFTFIFLFKNETKNLYYEK